MEENIFRIPCDDLADACRITAGFVKDRGVYLPECVVIGSDGSVRIADRKEAESAERLLAFVRSQDAAEALFCTAATDSQDVNRVVLTYLTGVNILTLSFPMAEGRLSEKEYSLAGRIGALRT